MTQAPAGWYPQPDGTQRYWDGSAWTDHIAPGATQAAAAAAPPAEVAPPAAVEAPEAAAIPAPPAPAAAPQAFAAVPPVASSSYAAMPGEVASPGGVAVKKRRVWPWVLGIVGGLIVLGIIAVVLIVVFVVKAVGEPKSAAEDFNKAYFSGDCQGYLDVTTQNFRDEDGYPGTCEEATSTGYFPEDFGDSFEIKLNSFEIVNGDATVSGTMESVDFGDTDLIYHLVKVDGKWLVDSIE